MKEENKKILKIIGIELIFLLSAVIVACGATLVQFIGRKYLGNHKSFLFGGNEYEYNIISYLGGILIYFSYLIISYKMLLKKYIDALLKYKLGFRILAWVICTIMSLGTFVAIIIVLLLTLGLGSNMNPEWLIYVTTVGWPFLTVILFSYLLIRKRVQDDLVEEV